MKQRIVIEDADTIYPSPLFPYDRLLEAFLEKDVMRFCQEMYMEALDNFKLGTSHLAYLQLEVGETSPRENDYIVTYAPTMRDALLLPFPRLTEAQFHEIDLNSVPFKSYTWDYMRQNVVLLNQLKQQMRDSLKGLADKIASRRYTWLKQSPLYPWNQALYDFLTEEDGRTLADCIEQAHDVYSLSLHGQIVDKNEVQKMYGKDNWGYYFVPNIRNCGEIIEWYITSTINEPDEKVRLLLPLVPYERYKTLLSLQDEMQDKADNSFISWAYALRQSEEDMASIRQSLWYQLYDKADIIAQIKDAWPGL